MYRLSSFYSKVCKTSFLLIFITFCVFAKAQNDTTPKPGQPGFSSFSSLFQFSFGSNIPVGSYRGSEIPFSNSFARAKYEPLNLHASYVQKLGKRVGLTAGAIYTRNILDSEAFYKAYLKKYGDSLMPGKIRYEHLGFYAGAVYTYNTGSFLFSVSASAGGMYTFLPPTDLGLEVSPGRSSVENYKGGSMELGKTLRLMGVLNFDVRYDVGSDMFIVGGLNYVQSSYRLKILEKGPFYGDPEKEYLVTYPGVNNIGYTIGLGILFR